MARLTSDLSQRQYAAIGKVACEWAHVEFTLRYFVEKIAGMEQFLALKFTTELGSTSLLNLLFALLYDRSKDDKNQPPLYQHLKAAEQLIIDRRTDRNTIIHLDWLRSDTDRRKALAFKLTAKGKLQIKKQLKSAAEIEAVALAIAALNDVLWQHWNDNEAGRLQPLPPKPPSPHLKRRNPPRDKRQERQSLP